MNRRGASPRSRTALRVLLGDDLDHRCDCGRRHTAEPTDNVALNLTPVSGVLNEGFCYGKTYKV